MMYTILDMILAWASPFNFSMPDIWKTVPDNQTITIEQNVQFLVGIQRFRGSIKVINSH